MRYWDRVEASFNPISGVVSVRLDMLRANIWICCQSGGVYTINILDKILVKRFRSCGIEKTNVIPR
jgi:hypothetical protein